MSFLTTGRSRHFTEHQSIMKSDNLKMISWSVADPLFLRHSVHSTEGDTNLKLGARCNYFNTFFILYVSNKVLKLLKNVSEQWQSGFWYWTRFVVNVVFLCTNKRVNADDWTAEFPIIASHDVDVLKGMVGVNKQPYVTSDNVICWNALGSTRNCLIMFGQR